MSLFVKVHSCHCDQARIRASSLELPPDPVPIQANPEALRRVLLILMDNAAKYTPQGGSVRAELSAKEGRAVASVADTGIGIDSQDLARVFDRFWRADEARSREQGAAGLGLSIAKWIVDVYGGSICVKNELGKGSTFTIRLPSITA